MLKPLVNILLIEDDEDDYILTQDSLSSLPEWEVKLTWINDAKAGLQALQNTGFDLCLLDYQLGAMTGIDLLREIQQLDISTPVVMLTGQADDAVDKAALDAGATDYLLKSDVDSGRFIRTIRYALARRDTERERIERQKAESENRAKDRFLAHLSHELRTPLSAILGYTELLISKSTPQSHHELNAIMRNGRHLLSLLNDVLDLSKIAADKLELTPSRIQFHALINEVIALTQGLALEKNLQLNLISHTDIPTELYIDATRLRQILINLIGNAIKFTHTGKVDVELEVIQHSQHRQLRIAVNDTGIGIGKDDLRKIFQPFEQVDDVVHKTVQGTGLGLAICAELVQRMGGEIKVSSEPGQGSCFSVLIPLLESYDSPCSPLTRMTHEYTAAETPNLKGHVLVVDDMADLRALMIEQMLACGVTAVGSQNGQQALAKVAANTDTPFDLIFLDLHMPVMDGYTCIKELRQRCPDTPILALTAATLKGRAEQLLALGFTDMLAKPMERQTLLDTLRHYLTSQDSDSVTSSELRLLLVEDDKDAADATSTMLTLNGGKVTWAEDGKSCLQRLEQENFDRLIIDLGLPDIDGLTLISNIRQRWPDIEIVVLSGNDVDQADVTRLGISKCFRKPLFTEHIRELTQRELTQ